MSSGRRWVKTVNSLTARPRARSARARRRRAPRLRRPAGTIQANVSRLPFGPGSPEETKRITPAPSASAARPTSSSASRRASGSRTTPPLPTRARPTSNWGLTIASASQSPPRHAIAGPSTFVSEMKETSATASVGWLVRRGPWSGQHRRGQLARVRALEHLHPRVLAEPVVEDPVADVDRDDLARPSLQQAVGEAACRRADVERAPSRHLEPRCVERIRELDAAARDVGVALLDDEELLGIDHLTRLLGATAPAAQHHLARHHRRRGPCAGWEQPALGQQGVQTLLAHGGTLAQKPRPQGACTAGGEG